jgi:Flp pilus assembly protein TadB
MDVDLFWVAALFWTVSFLRVIGAAVRHEVFGTEATLALAAVLALPWIVLGAHRARRARRLDPR